MRWKLVPLVLVVLPVAAAPKPKNVILFVGDGMGFHHVQVTRQWLGRPLSFESFPRRLASSTHSASNPDGYDPSRAWESLDYLKQGATDSAAAATALACGVKTKNGTLGLDPDGRPVDNVVEVASAAGKATGVVTSVMWSHATPAAMAVHVTERGSYEEIARQMLASELDVILGAGHPLYDDHGRTPEKPDYRYVGGEDVFGALRAGRHGDWFFFDALERFAELAAGTLNGRVVGTARVGSTLQEGRSGRTAESTPGSVPPTAGVPSLALMTRGALAQLARDPDGFFLMVEGGAIDWAAHDNLLERVIEETAEFSAAVAEAVDFVSGRSAWDRTLIIVTADHETGGLMGEPKGTIVEPIDRGPGRLPGAVFNSGGHTNSLVPVYARGRGAEALVALADEHDPRRGAYLDNTELGNLLKSQLAR